MLWKWREFGTESLVVLPKCCINLDFSANNIIKCFSYSNILGSQHNKVSITNTYTSTSPKVSRDCSFILAINWGQKAMNDSSSDVKNKVSWGQLYLTYFFFSWGLFVPFPSDWEYMTCFVKKRACVPNLSEQHSGQSKCITFFQACMISVASLFSHMKFTWKITTKQ